MVAWTSWRSMMGVVGCLVFWCTIAVGEQPAQPPSFFGAVIRSIFGSTSSSNPPSSRVEIENSQGSFLPSEAKPVAGTHQQVRLIELAKGDGLRLRSFAVMADGNLVTVQSTGGDGHGPEVADDGDARSRVDILDSEGNSIHSFLLDFRGSAVNIGPDGHIYIGGAGVIAKYDVKGQLLARTVAPHLEGLGQDEAAMEERAKEALAEQFTQLKERIEQLESQQKALDAESNPASSDPTQEKEVEFTVPSELIPAYKSMMEQYEHPTPEMIRSTAMSLRERQTKINAIAVNDQYVFVTCPATKGYGYTVWRTDLDFANAKQIVEGLSGCCGQMDVQCCGNELIVAENARHRVARYDAEGKKLSTFGKRSRDGEGAGFSSCCNPMNTRLVGDRLLVSESDGTIKRFDLKGEYIEFVGKAGVTAGCKSSIVAANADATRIYYFHVEKSGICVFEPCPVVANANP